ncbi:hypothetical protein BJ165DRAFT_426651 [Panaeolus papilionaceus]|nr:hypothetical protein BJ165DRAFT_426651 [Panaeolus papilionaceus]
MSALTIPSIGGRILINHPTYIVHTTVAHDANTFRLLYDQVCVAAYDNSDEVDPMKCYPGTRTLLLERLENWLAAQGNADRLITWLDGPMGSGKTAVARTMAERALANKKLVGMFMFRRGQPGRSDATRFVATLTYQMALSIPLVRQYIEDQLKHDPSVLQQSLSRQLDALILEPLRRMRSQVRDIDITTLPNLIIVDGLDECGSDEGLGKEDMQTRVLDLLHRLVLSQDVLPFSILIHSRPENHIKNWFTQELYESMTNRLTLNASYRPSADIRLFVTETFLKILRDHPNRHLLPPNWPYVVQDPRNPGKPVDAITILVNHSSGQFIYAATAMVYIASQHHRPDKRLVSLLFFAHDAEARAPNAPTAIIDALYAQVLNSTDDHEMVKRILAFYTLFLPLPLNIPHSRILSIISISIEDLRHCLQQLESLLTFTLTPPLKFHHSSFPEFLEDPLRSGFWFLNRDHYYSHFMLCALRVFHDESYVGAQTYCLRLLGFLRSRYPFRTISIYFQREVEQFCDFPNSSYRASVERFLSKVSLGSFIQLTQWVRDVRSIFSFTTTI